MQKSTSKYRLNYSARNNQFNASYPIITDHLFLFQSFVNGHNWDSLQIFAFSSARFRRGDSKRFCATGSNEKFAMKPKDRCCHRKYTTERGKNRGFTRDGRKFGNRMRSHEGRALYKFLFVRVKTFLRAIRRYLHLRLWLTTSGVCVYVERKDDLIPRNLIRGSNRAIVANQHRR